MPYLLALQGVRVLLGFAVQHYQRLESIGKQLQKTDKLKKAEVFGESEDKVPISFEEANILLSIIVGLEDQLWAMTKSDLATSRVKNLWSAESARVHTTFGRLSSLMSLPDSVDPV